MVTENNVIMRDINVDSFDALDSYQSGEEIQDMLVDFVLEHTKP